MDNTQPQFTTLQNDKKLIPISFLFRKSFEIYRQKFNIFLAIGLINMPLFVVSVIYNSLFSLKSMESISSNMPLFVLTGFIFFIISVAASIITIWSQLAMATSLHGDGLKMNVRELLAFAWLRLDSFLWVYFLVGIIILGGMIALVIPGIIFSVWFSLSLYVFLFENIKGTDALKKSKNLVKHYWWRVFSRFFMLGMFVFLVSVVTGWSLLVGTLINTFFLMPFAVVYGYLIYEDLAKMNNVI
jgi:hypothetical protein